MLRIKYYKVEISTNLKLKSKSFCVNKISLKSLKSKISSKYFRKVNSFALFLVFNGIYY